MIKNIGLLFFLFCFGILGGFSQNLNDSLIVYYPLDGNANDSSINNFDGKYFGNSANDCSGNSNAATYFDGIDDYIELPINNKLQAELPVSFSFRLKFLSYSKPKLFFTNDYSFTHYYGFWLNIDQNGYFFASYGDGGTQDISNRRSAKADTQLELNKWYDMTVVINGPTNTDFYINCDTHQVVYEGNGGPLRYSPDSSKATIGRFGRPPLKFEYFNGYLDEFRMWNRALSPQEVQMLHNSPCILSDTVSASICHGDSISINKLNYHTSTGIYVDTIHNATTLGCDSIMVLDLTVLPENIGRINATICEGDTFNFMGKLLSYPGNYTDTLTSAILCDSIVLLDLSVQPAVYTVLKDSMYSNASYIFNARNITEAGIYHDTLSAQNGCDSILSLYLSIKYPRGSIIKGICPDDTLFYNAEKYFQSGIYTDTLFAAASNGADSLFHLFINQLSGADCNPPLLDVPNIFTPNNDGLYDEFMLIGEHIGSYEINIFNRWGQKVFESNSLQQHWDGRLNGKACKNGIYFYFIQAMGTNGEKLTKSGSLSLIR